ncbi:MAG: hypothetical protein JNL60_08145 [Bacteroidia bacterium]|nr:hypothetical protein [Bacteroidia bacterium]
MKKIVFLLTVLIFSQCKKYVAGPQGDPGEPGKKGNAKQSNRNYDMIPSFWTFNGSFYTANINVPEITDNVITNGEVTVFMKVNDQWWKLPYAVGDIYMQLSIEKGFVKLKYSKIHDGPPEAPGMLSFRIITMAVVK